MANTIEITNTMNETFNNLTIEDNKKTFDLTKRRVPVYSNFRSGRSSEEFVPKQKLEKMHGINPVKEVSFEPLKSNKKSSLFSQEKENTAFYYACANYELIAQRLILEELREFNDNDDIGKLRTIPRLGHFIAKGVVPNDEIIEIDLDIETNPDDFEFLTFADIALDEKKYYTNAHNCHYGYHTEDYKNKFINTTNKFTKQSPHEWIGNRSPESWIINGVSEHPFRKLQNLFKTTLGYFLSDVTDPNKGSQIIIVVVLGCPSSIAGMHPLIHGLNNIDGISLNTKVKTSTHIISPCNSIIYKD